MPNALTKAPSTAGAALVDVTGPEASAGDTRTARQRTEAMSAVMRRAFIGPPPGGHREVGPWKGRGRHITCAQVLRGASQLERFRRQFERLAAPGRARQRVATVITIATRPMTSATKRSSTESR